MALAVEADVEAALGRSLTATESNRLDSLLAKASAVVIGYTGQDFEPAPYPEAVAAIVGEMVARSMDTSSTAGAIPEQQGAGPFSIRFGSSAAGGGVWLTKSDKLALRAYRRGGGVTSVQFVGERYEITETS